MEIENKKEGNNSEKFKYETNQNIWKKKPEKKEMPPIKLLRISRKREHIKGNKNVLRAKRTFMELLK